MAEPDKSSDEHESEGQPENSLPEHAEEHEGQQENWLPEQAEEHEDDPVAGAGEMWPGWPGESVFRILVPAQKVGSIIGRKGEYIKKMCEETKARIKILDGPPGTTERAVMISAKEEPNSSLPPAINGLLRVHKRVVDGLDNDASQAPPLAGGKVSTRLLVPAAQAANLIGKQGVTVKSIKETSNCIVRVIGTDALPIFALEDDRIVEVVGEPAAVHKAVELVASHLRKFLVDRSIIPIFEVQMQKPISQIEYVPPPMPSWGPPPHPFPPSVTGPAGYGSNSHFAPPPRQNENYYPPLELPPHLEKQPHQGISAYGEAPLAAQPSTNNQPVQSLFTQVSQQMRVPLTYADAVIGNAGARISYIRRISGATVSIQETRGVPGEMTVEINGTASQVQTAQQLIQNFMGEAAAVQTQTAPPVSQGYNVYAAQSNVYAPAPSNSDLVGQTGGYGSVYGANYGY